MMRIAILANLAMFSIVVSQPIFYMVSMTKVQLGLPASAYIELRQRINPVMNKRLPLVYLATVCTSVLLLVLALWSDERLVLITTAVALLCLIVDAVVTTRVNLPLNNVMDAWSTADYPTDWQSYRERWFTVYRYRQLCLVVGFASLLVGAVFRS